MDTVRHSSLQVQQSCGDTCATAGLANWTRFHTNYRKGRDTNYRKGRGFLAAFDLVRYCTSRDQEFRREWRDRDHIVAECWGGIRVEHWTQCGCSSQTLVAMCVDKASGIDVEALIAATEGGSPPEQSTGQLIALIEQLDEQGLLTENFSMNRVSVYMKLAFLSSYGAEVPRVENASAVQFSSLVGQLPNNEIDMVRCEVWLLAEIKKIVGGEIRIVDLETILGSVLKTKK